jgi:hypothetical protein
LDLDVDERLCPQIYASKASNEYNVHMKARRIGIGLLLATAGIVGHVPMLPISKELPVKHNIEGVATAVMTGTIDIRGV